MPKFLISLMRELLQEATIEVEVDNREAATQETDVLMGETERQQIIWTTAETKEPWVEEITEIPAEARAEAEAEANGR